MRKLLLPLCSFLLVSAFFAGCDDEKAGDDDKTFSVSGTAEKGPFVNGSTVHIYELDKNMSQTGNSFTANTNDEGYFEFIGSSRLSSDYIKLSVNGYYFNEVTGKLSQAPITLEALADVRNKNEVNANLITHLETKRVMHLITKEKMGFKEAKRQAEKELLACFLIRDKEIIPEEASITANNTQADILIAISSILLRTIEIENQAEAQFTQLINNFRDDFETDGKISSQLKETIKKASYGLDYITVKDNIINRYGELGKNVSVGNFHYFIDGDNSGELKEEDYFIDTPPEGIISGNDYFKTEEQFIAATTSVFKNILEIVQDLYVLDAFFTNTAGNNDDYLLQDIYNHTITSRNSFTEGLWNKLYKSFQLDNTIIEASKNKPEFAKYGYNLAVFRAYKYLNMTELWGDVPFIVKVVEFGDAAIPRTNKTDIINFLIEDLKEAESYLPEKGDNMICSKYLASALLAKAYLLKGDYSNALAFASKIINNNTYSLSGNYNSIFEPGNTESLFSLLTNIETNHTFKNYIQKGSQIPVMRYAGILLIAAESYLAQGNRTEAIALINQLKDRNWRSKIDANASSETIKKAIVEEWEKDLNNEGVYFFALKRAGLSEEILNIPSYMNLLPIPEREMQLNPAIVQNPGYY